MNKANECTCPSGDGSLVHPCPAHPAVEQVGGDERAAFEAAFAAMGRPVCRADYDQDAYGTPFDDGGWTGWQARAALAQPSGEVVVTKNESGAIVSVTRQDKEGRVLSVIAESATLTAQAEKAEVERPEGPTEDELEAAGLGYPLHKEEAVKLWYSGFRSEVITVLEAWEAIGHDIGMNPDKGELLDSLRYMLEKCEAHDAALARVAELERGKVYVEARQCDECQHGGINDSATGVAACHECDWTGPEPEEDRCPGCQRENCMAAACPQCGARYVLVASEEIAAPVAQAQHSVPVAREQLERLVRILDAHNYAKDAEALMALLAAAPAQAQHSVPEGLALIPVRETEAMHDAVMALLYKGVARTDTQKLLDAYIAAAPQPAGGE
ncbi:TPA: hypothetical protein ACXJUY_005191 [Pseudomonas aeruginosa]